MSSHVPASKLMITMDALKSILITLCDDRMANYHVRAIFASPDEVGNMRDMNAVYCATPDMDERIKIEMEDVGMEFVGYAVYGCTPAGRFVCGDELSYKSAARIAKLLNRFYSDPSIMV